MALNEVQQSFKFAGGVETKMDPKAVPSVRLLDLQNGVFTKAVSIQKRNGYSASSKLIDSGTEISGARRLANRDNEVLLFTNDRCYSKQTEADQWSDAGPVVCATGTDRAATATSSQQTTPDHARLGGVTAYAWEDSRGGVWWTTEDTQTGAVLRAPEQADALGERPRCVAVGEAIHIYYAVPTARTIMVIVVNPSSPAAAVAPAILVNDLRSANPAYDACPTARPGTPAFIAWHEHGTFNIRCGYVTGGGVLGGPASGHPSVHRIAADAHVNTPVAAAFRYGDGGTGDRLLIGYYTDTLHEGVVDTLDGGTSGSAIGGVASASDVLFAAPPSIVRLALAVADGVVWAAADAGQSGSENTCAINSLVIGGAVGTERTVRSVGLASRGFTAGSSAYATFVHDTTYFNVYMVLRLSDSLCVGRHLPGSAGGPAQPHLPSAHTDGSVISMVLPYRTRVDSEDNDKFTETALRLVRLDFNDDDSHQTAQIGRGLYMAGACPQHYDGRQWTEQGFHVGPELITDTPAAGGNLTVGSVYQYLVWYEWTDAQGEIHRGPVSPGYTATTGGADTQFTLTLPTLRVTAKSNVRICVGRSLPGETARLWRVSSLDPTTAGAAANGYVANDPTVDSVSFVDRMSDAVLQKQEPLYTTGGVLSNDPVALGSLVAVGKNRLFFADAAEGNIVRYSKRIATGFGAEFAPELKHDVDPRGGDITALWVLDQAVVVFQERSIQVFNGEGALENGSTALGGFSYAQRVPGEVGCVAPSSIVETPDGLMFKSDKGIWLLGRDFNLDYTGAPVEAYNAQDVRRANTMPGRTQVAFLTTAGRTLLYDHLFRQWSTFTNHEGKDAVVAGGTYRYLRNDDTLYTETVGAYSDAGAQIRLRLETAWLHLYEHLQGLQRFWTMVLLGTWVSPHQLGVQYRTSYDESWSDPSWLDATGGTDATGWLSGTGVSEVGLDPVVGSAYGSGSYGAGPYGGTPNSVYQWRLGIHEKGQSIQFRFEDFEKYGLAGASFELTEMSITGGAMKPTTRPFSGTRST